MKRKISKFSGVLGFGSAGSMFLAIAGGTCAAGVCGLAAFPVAALLSNLGLHALVPYLPGLRVPLIVLAGILGIFVIRNVNRRGSPLQSSMVGALLGGLFVFSVMETFVVPSRVAAIPRTEESQAQLRTQECNADVLPPYLRAPNG